MSMKAKPPTDRAVATALGPVKAVWAGIVAALEQAHGPLDREWKTSKSDFGWMCLLKQKSRTLLYLTPEKGAIRVAVVFGERAVALALASDLPGEIKQLLTEAKPYAEGRGIRFAVTSVAEVPTVAKLVALKTTPK